jgi:hypothetical protein
LLDWLENSPAQRLAKRPLLAAEADGLNALHNADDHQVSLADTGHMRA